MPVPVERSPRFREVLDYIHTHGPLQMPFEELVEAVGVPERSLHRHLRRMEELGLVIVDRSAMFGEGREPNRYRAIVTPKQWDERMRATLAEDERAKARERDRRRRALRSEQDAALAAEAAQAEMLRMVEELDQPDPIIVQIEETLALNILGIEDADLVDAWLGGDL